MTFDIIIPTYKPGEELKALLKGILIQTLRPDNIYIINTEEKFWKKEFEDILPVKVICFQPLMTKRLQYPMPDRKLMKRPER